MLHPPYPPSLANERCCFMNFASSVLFWLDLTTTVCSFTFFLNRSPSFKGNHLMSLTLNTRIVMSLTLLYARTRRWEAYWLGSCPAHRETLLLTGAGSWLCPTTDCARSSTFFRGTLDWWSAVERKFLCRRPFNSVPIFRQKWWFFGAFSLTCFIYFCEISYLPSLSRAKHLSSLFRENFPHFGAG